MIRGVGIHHADQVSSRLGSCDQQRVQVPAMISEPNQEQEMFSASQGP